jgi:hypothetical protein
MSEYSPRQMRKIRRDLRYNFIKEMKRDVSYLLKPRPRILPFKIWIWCLAKLLKLDNESIKHVCLTSSSKAKTI